MTLRRLLQRNTGNVKNDVDVCRIVSHVNLHVAVGDGLDLGSLRMLLGVVLLAEAQQPNGGEVLSVHFRDHTNVAHQQVHRVVGAQEFAQHVIQQGQAVVTYP